METFFNLLHAHVKLQKTLYKLIQLTPILPLYSSLCSSNILNEINDHPLKFNQTNNAKCNLETHLIVNMRLPKSLPSLFKKKSQYDVKRAQPIFDRDFYLPD